MKRSSPIVGVLLLSFMGLVFAGVGGGLAFFIGWPQVQKAKESEDWPATEGVVTQSRVVSSQDNEGSTTYRAEVLYEFTVEGEKLEGERVWFGDDVSTSGGKTARQTVRDYPVGKEVEVYYDPDDPLETCLLPGTFYSTYFMLVFGGIFLLVGLLMLIYPATKLLVLFFALFTVAGKTSARDDRFFTADDARNTNDIEDDAFDIR